MTAISQIYKCELCGNMVEIVHAGDGQLVCCDQPMVEVMENTTDAAQEKHVPVIEQLGDSVKVTVGTVAHPMEDDHYIEWIEILAGELIQRVELKPGGEPTATFSVASGSNVSARAYCNKHGLWKS